MLDYLQYPLREGEIIPIQCSMKAANPIMCMCIDEHDHEIATANATCTVQRDFIRVIDSYKHIMYNRIMTSHTCSIEAVGVVVHSTREQKVDYSVMSVKACTVEPQLAWMWIM